MTLFKNLTKKENKHLKEMGMTTLRQFKETAETQAAYRAEGLSEPCYECKNIARKLGLPV